MTERKRKFDPQETKEVGDRSDNKRTYNRDDFHGRGDFHPGSLKCERSGAGNNGDRYRGRQTNHHTYGRSHHRSNSFFRGSGADKSDRHGGYHGRHRDNSVQRNGTGYNGDRGAGYIKDKNTNFDVSRYNHRDDNHDSRRNTAYEFETTIEDVEDDSKIKRDANSLIRIHRRPFVQEEKDIEKEGKDGEMSPSTLRDDEEGCGHYGPPICPEFDKVETNPHLLQVATKNYF